MYFRDESERCNWLNSKEGGCGQGQNRTADTRIFSPLLYRLSYLARRLEYCLKVKWSQGVLRKRTTDYRTTDYRQRNGTLGCGTTDHGTTDS